MFVNTSDNYNVKCFLSISNLKHIVILRKLKAPDYYYNRKISVQLQRLDDQTIIIVNSKTTKPKPVQKIEPKPTRKCYNFFTRVNQGTTLRKDNENQFTESADHHEASNRKKKNQHKISNTNIKQKTVG